MSFSIRLLVSSLCAIAVAMAQEPRLVRNAAALNAGSYMPAGLPQSGVAAGARAVVLGTNLAGELQEQPTAESLAFAGVTAKVVVGDAERDAYVLLVAPQRVEFLVPADLPAGSGTVRLTVNGTELSAPITVVSSAPGIGTRGSLGAGPAFALDSSANEITPSRPAVPGDTIRIRTTGIGPDTAMGNYEIIVGGTAVAIGGLSRQPNGWDDLTFELPAATATGCSVPVFLRGANYLSNFVPLPVGAAGEACKDAAVPAGLDLEKLLREGARTGTISLSRSELSNRGIKLVADAGSGSFYRFPQWSPVGVGGFASWSTVGNCTLVRARVPETGTTEIPPFEGLDAGAALSVTGPGGTRPMAGTREKGSYSGDYGQRFDIPTPIPIPQTPLFLEAGEYTVSGPGGADVGSFSAQIRIGTPVVWRNADTFGTACGEGRCVARDQDLKLDWTGGDDQRTVSVMGTASVGRDAVVSFQCTAKADQGTLTVPAAILSALPPVENTALTMMVLTEPVLFQASGLDYGAVHYVQTFLRQMSLR
ncbi:MAG: hypothetical protein JNK87_08290 [Bryobacterales bacterium]|nr:hypothetical protein [Bryobacterales bacterium]